MPSFSTSNLTTETAIQLFGVYVWDADRGPEDLQFISSKSKASRKILVGLNDLPALLANALAPLAPIASGNNFPPGYAHPVYPWMRIVSVDVGKLIPTQQGLVNITYATGFGGLANLVGGNYLECTLRYGQLDYAAFDTGELAYKFGVEQIDTSKLTLYDSSGGGIPYPPLYMPNLNISYTKKQQAAIPATTMVTAAAAPFNSQPFYLNTGGTNVNVSLVADTVMYLGSETDRQTQGAGTGSWNVRHHFQWRPVGWSKFLKTSFSANPTTFADMYQTGYIDPAHTTAFVQPASDIWTNLVNLNT